MLNTIIKLILLAFLFLPGISFAEVININTADKATLMDGIKGVGEKRAEAIIEYRNQHGPFKSVDELAKITGISQAIVEDNRTILIVDEE